MQSATSQAQYRSGSGTIARICNDAWSRLRNCLHRIHGAGHQAIFDDTVLDKNFSHQIKLVRLQYSGNAHSLVRSIGLVNCVYLNPEADQYWVIDYRLNDAGRDGKSKLDRKSKLDHVHIDSLHKIDCCPLQPTPRQPENVEARGTGAAGTVGSSL